MQRTTSGTLTVFGLYLRTGRRIAATDVEVKYNPWHDEETGRFTFAGQGRHFGAGGADGSFRGSGSFGGAGAQDSWSAPSERRESATPERRGNSPHHPANHSVHVVQPGDTLSRIAARRKGLTPRGLAWLNAQTIDQPLKVGQRIKLPHQAYLDAGRAAKNKLLSATQQSSQERQILDKNWRRETKNGYAFDVDPIKRAREISGDLQNGPTASRSRTNQRNAGKPDRRLGDDGGHFIATRFNGPRDSINHFAQDANFNRGTYRAMEDKWAKNLASGHHVSVNIRPLYEGASTRPYQLIVTWSVDGRKTVQKFANEAEGKANGR